LDIPDSLYLQASAKAMSFGQDVGDFVVTVLQRELGLPLSKKGFETCFISSTSMF
jgi:hypothetical protein